MDLPQVKSVTMLNIKKLILDLNASLLELESNKDIYKTQTDECKNLCSRIRELMDDTTRTITSK